MMTPPLLSEVDDRLLSRMTPSSKNRIWVMIDQLSTQVCLYEVDPVPSPTLGEVSVVSPLKIDELKLQTPLSGTRILPIHEYETTPFLHLDDSRQRNRMKRPTEIRSMLPNLYEGVDLELLFPNLITMNKVLELDHLLINSHNSLLEADKGKYLILRLNKINEVIDEVVKVRPWVLETVHLYWLFHPR
jgi:hypothetical protein